MSNPSEEKMKKIEETNVMEVEEVTIKARGINVDAVANALIKIQDGNHKVRSEFVDLHPMVLKVTQDIVELRAQINELKAAGARGTLGGTGSTVHKQDE